MFYLQYYKTFGNDEDGDEDEEVKAPPPLSKVGDKNINRKNSVQSQQTFGGGKGKQSENNTRESPLASEVAQEETNLAKRNKRDDEAP